jgi:hypothetical protein
LSGRYRCIGYTQRYFGRTSWRDDGPRSASPHTLRTSLHSLRLSDSPQCTSSPGPIPVMLPSRPRCGGRTCSVV